MIVARCDRAVVSLVFDVILICFYLLRCLSTRFPLFFPRCGCLLLDVCIPLKKQSVFGVLWKDVCSPFFALSES